MAEVRVQIEREAEREPLAPPAEEPREPQEPREPLGRRLRDYTLNRIAGVLTPIVEHVNHTHLQPILWMNGGVTPDVSVTISNQPESAQPAQPADNRVQINLPDIHIPELNQLVPPNVERNDADNNNQNNRVVDLNFNEYIPILSKCALFLSILVVKFLYDHLEGVLTFIFMQMLFSFLGDDQINFRNKNILRFLINISVIGKCLEYIYLYEGLPLTIVVYNSNFDFPTDIWDTLWIVYMNDCALQLSTMLLKMPVKCFPLKYMTIRSKLKIYSFLETISQFYRNIVPIQPWLCYLYDVSKSSSFPQLSYIMGIFLCSAYAILKTSDVIRKMVFVKSTIQKLCKRTGIVNLNKEQLASKELKCSICLDDFNCPLQLSCQHIFCSACIIQWSVKNKTCPLCRTVMNEDFVSENIASSVFLQLF